MYFEAAAVLESVLRPISTDQFFEDILGHRPLLLTDFNRDRQALAGINPRRQLLRGFARYAPTLTSHAYSPTGTAPVARAVGSPDAFYELIKGYFQVGHTVRIPDVTDFSEPLSLLTRSLEKLIHSKVGVVAFWSQQGAAAPVHHDDVDVIVIQLEGHKRWFISDSLPLLPNKWKLPGEQAPVISSHQAVDLKPGDFLYVPRGTAHTVHSTTESLHLAIGFVPVTVRDAINAVLDHYSDLNRPLRAGAGKRADSFAKNQDVSVVFEQIRKHMKALTEAAHSDTFLRAAMNRRKARMIMDLPKLPKPGRAIPIGLASRVRHHPLAMAELTVTDHILDLSQPGEQILIHTGVRESIEFMLNHHDFVVSDIPGAIDNEVRIALVQRFISSGLLVCADSPLPTSTA